LDGRGGVEEAINPSGIVVADIVFDGRGGKVAFNPY